MVLFCWSVSYQLSQTFPSLPMNLPHDASKEILPSAAMFTTSQLAQIKFRNPCEVWYLSRLSGLSGFLWPVTVGKPRYLRAYLRQWVNIRDVFWRSDLNQGILATLATTWHG
ncbi:hypothetical protein DSL72_002546 [Monilinia vaccinii-corymbosi]|uniref:Uncharacterized protein n=1 Tax=Monilinia vaccinii-corymbosi TaxID=61207 RepID=A0A8A3PD08_9HELO|nr:hypothetical protein DSL72_002546 [Monilinia vaccinii-corymbosi]